MTSDSNAADERAARFEQALSFQQRMLEELHEVLLRQQSEIDALRREQTRLQTEMQRLAERTESDLPLDEKPPHY